MNNMTTMTTMNGTEEEIITELTRRLTGQSSTMKQQEIKQLKQRSSISGTSTILSGFSASNRTREIVSRFVVVWRARRVYAKHLKRARVRLMIIRELVKTEETYVSKLRIITLDLREGMRRILQNEADIQKIFNNVEEILKLSEAMFLQYLKEHTVNLAFNSKVFSAQVLKIIPFFKIYSDYLQLYDESMKLLEKLQTTNREVAEYLRVFEDDHEPVQSLLIRPVQQLPRYKLLFNELLSKTPTDHCDYIYIKQCLDAFEVVCGQVNASIQRYLDNEKIFQLARNFKDYNLQLIEKRKEFKFEEKLGLIEEGEKQCVVSFLNDMLLVQEKIDEETMRGLRWVQLDQRSLVKSTEDMKYYKHIFKVSGVNTVVTLMAENKEQKHRVIAQIEALIRDTREGDIDNIEVNVLGTEQWNTTQIQNFTVYVAELRIVNVSLKIWLRYSQLVHIQKKINSYVKGSPLPKLSTKFSWLINNRTRTIENRKIQFESFLKMILTMKEIKNSGIIHEILSDLGLPKDFYDLPYKSNPNALNSPLSSSTSGVGAAASSSSNSFFHENHEVWGELDRFTGDSDGEEDSGCPIEFSDAIDLSQHLHRQGFVPPSVLTFHSSCPADLRARSPPKLSSITNMDVSQSLSQSQNSKQLLQSQLSLSNNITGSVTASNHHVYMKSHSISTIGKYSASETFHLHRISSTQGNRYRKSQTAHNIDDADNDRCSIEVELMDGSKRNLEIDTTTRGFDLCRATARRIGLKSHLDHRIFLKDPRGNYRVLDDEESVMKALFPQQKHLYSSAQLVEQTSNSAIVTGSNSSTETKKAATSITTKIRKTIGINHSKSQNYSSEMNKAHLTSREFIESNIADDGILSASDLDGQNKSRLWVYSPQQASNAKSTSIWQRVWRNLKKLKHYTIVFKKYLWLSPEQEELDIRQDPVRLRLISYQIFSEILAERFQLSHKQYALFAALHFYIEHEAASAASTGTETAAAVDVLHSLSADRIKEKIPKSIYNQKPTQFWVDSVMQNLEMLTKEIDAIHCVNNNLLNNSTAGMGMSSNQVAKDYNDNNIIQHQQEQQEEFYIFQESSNSCNISSASSAVRGNGSVGMINGNSRDSSIVAQRIQAMTVKSILREKVQLMQMVVINAIKDNPLFGVTQFYVNTYKETLRFAKESQVKIEENVWLGIKHNTIYLLGPEFKEILLTISYDILQSKRVFPKQIHLTLFLNAASHDWRFITTTSLEISQLIQEYQNINSLLKNTLSLQNSQQNNSQLIS